MNGSSRSNGQPQPQHPDNKAADPGQSLTASLFEHTHRVWSWASDSLKLMMQDVGKCIPFPHRDAVEGSKSSEVGDALFYWKFHLQHWILL